MNNNETSDSSENSSTSFRDFYPVNQPYGFVGIEINEDLLDSFEINPEEVPIESLK